MGVCKWGHEIAGSPVLLPGGHVTSLQSPGDSACGAGTDPAKLHLTPFLWCYNVQCAFLLSSSSSFFFHKNLKPFSVLQLSLHKPGGFSSGSEKLIPRFPLSHISTARPLSRAELGGERIVKEMGHFQCLTLVELSWNH